MRYVGLGRDHLRSHFVFRPRHAPEWLRTRFLGVVFLANEEELTGNTFTTSVNTTNPNTYVKFIFLLTSPLMHHTQTWALTWLGAWARATFFETSGALSRKSSISQCTAQLQDRTFWANGTEKNMHKNGEEACTCPGGFYNKRCFQLALCSL